MEETKCDGAYRRSFARAFPGIDRRAARAGAREMVNFRIADDGTLVKRCGYDSAQLSDAAAPGGGCLSDSQRPTGRIFAVPQYLCGISSGGADSAVFREWQKKV